MLQIEGAVRAGAAFLDLQLPGWQKQINLSTLDLQSMTRCILGQLYGTYGRGTIDLGLRDDLAAQLGFVLPFKYTKTHSHAEIALAYEMLTLAWVNTVRAALFPLKTVLEPEPALVIVDEASMIERELALV